MTPLTTVWGLLPAQVFRQWHEFIQRYNSLRLRLSPKRGAQCDAQSWGVWLLARFVVCLFWQSFGAICHTFRPAGPETTQLSEAPKQRWLQVWQAGVQGPQSAQLILLQRNYLALRPMEVGIAFDGAKRQRVRVSSGAMPIFSSSRRKL